MPNVTGVGQTGIQPNSGVAASQEASAPAELQGARPSRGARIGRVLLGIFTLGVSEGIRALIRFTSEALAQAERRVAADPGIPAARPRADAFNQSIADGLKKQALPPAFQAAVAEAIEEMRARFGTEVVPEGTTLATIPDSYGIRAELSKELRAMGEEVTPQILRAKMEARLQQAYPKVALEQRIAEHCAQKDYKVDTFTTQRIVKGVLARYPQMVTDLKASDSLEALTPVLDANMPHIEAEVAFRKQIDETQAKAKDTIIANLARATGLSEQIVSQKLNMEALNSSISFINEDFSKGLPLASKEAVESAYGKLVERFTQQKTALLTAVDELNVPVQLRESMKEEILTQPTLSKVEEFKAWTGIGIRTEVDTDQLIQALKAPASEANDKQVYELLRNLGLKVVDALVEHYGAAGWFKLGGDGQTDAKFYAIKAMLGAHPELIEALASRPELRDNLRTLLWEELAQSTDPELNSTQPERAQQLRHAVEGARYILEALPPLAGERNASLAKSLGQPDMPAFHAHKLDTAVAEMRTRFGEGSLPEGGFAQVMGAYDPRPGSSRLGARMSEALQASTKTIESDDMATMFAQTARTAAAYGAFKNIMGNLAKEFGLSLSDESINWLSTMLRQRHPDLIQSLERAENRADVEAIVDSLKDLGALMQMEHDVQAAWNDSVESIVAGMTAATGLPRAEVEARLDLSGLTSGRLAYLRQEFRELCANPETPPEAMPSSQRIRDDYRQVADAFLAGKRGLYTSIDGLGLSPELAARWKEDVLQQLTLRRADFLQRSVEIARGMREGGLTSLLTEPGIANETLLDAFLFIGMRKEEMAHSVYSAAEIGDMGSDELSLLDSTARDAFLDRNPGLVAAMRADASRMKAVFELGESQLIDLQRQMARVPLNSPEGGELRARYGALSTACSMIGSVVDVH